MTNSTYVSVELNTEKKEVIITTWYEGNSNRTGLDGYRTSTFKTIRDAINSYPQCADAIIKTNPEYADRINAYQEEQRKIRNKTVMSYSQAQAIVKGMKK